MVKATFYLPLQDNDGRDLHAEIQAVEDECFVAFGVWTQVGFFKGAWRMESGLKQVDTHAVYTIVLKKSQLGEMEAILLRFKAKTTQEAIYLETGAVTIRLL